jgi:outer membrane protein OmpA-like peptidoglycan-associated protein
MKIRKFTFLLINFFLLTGGLLAQTEFPVWDFWSIDAGIGMSDILVSGKSFQIIIDPKVWLSPQLMAGSRIGINYSNEDESVDILSNIVTFEGQAYLRWNFLSFGSNVEKKVNLFIQAGLGLISSYRGINNPFDDVTLTRGSLLFEAAAGVTVPLTARWHIEPSVRGGYPHILGFSITGGYKFPLPQKTKYTESPSRTEYVDRTEYVERTEYIDRTEYVDRIEYIEIIKTLPPEEIIKLLTINSIEFVLFGPDIGRYNIGVDRDAQGLNELVLNSAAQALKENSYLRVRIEGHANPVTTDPNEADELMSLGSIRANAVADQFRRRGVSEEQMVVISYGGTRTVTGEHDIWNRNRRVELMIIQIAAE